MRHRPSNWSIFYRQQKPIFTDVTTRNRARLASGIRSRCILRAPGFLRRALKCIRTGKERVHPSTSIVDVCFHRISAVLSRSSNVCTYIHSGYFLVLRDLALRLFRLAALFPSLFLVGSREKRKRNSRAARQVVQRLLSTTVSSSSIIFHDIARQVVYRSSLVDYV